MVDIENWQSVADHLEGIDVIQHVAGAVKAGSREEFDRINAGSTAAMVKAARQVCPEALLYSPPARLHAAPAAPGPSPPTVGAKCLRNKR